MGILSLEQLVSYLFGSHQKKAKSEGTLVYYLSCTHNYWVLQFAPYNSRHARCFCHEPGDETSY